MKKAFHIILLAGLLIAATSDMFLGGTLTYNRPRWEDHRIPVSSLRPQTGAPFASPDWVQFPSDATFTYALGLSSSADEGFIFEVQFSHARKDDSDFEFHVHGSATDNNTGTVTLKLVCSGLTDIGEHFTAAGVTKTVTFTVAANSLDDHLYQSATGGDISGGTSTISSMMSCALYRDVDDGDDYGADFIITEVDFHIQIDTPGGSYSEASK